MYVSIRRWIKKPQLKPRMGANEREWGGGGELPIDDWGKKILTTTCPPNPLAKGEDTKTPNGEGG